MSIENAVLYIDHAEKLINEFKENKLEISSAQWKLLENAIYQATKAANGLKPNRRNCETCQGKGYVFKTT